MAEQYRFFGSAVGDTREYSQVEFAEVFGTIIGNGYLGQVGNELVTTENTPVGMSVLVGTGKAWINGYWYSNESVKEIPISTADATNPRIDRVVLRLDVLNARSIVAVVKTGTPASTPVAPSLTQTEQLWEIPLYQVYVAPAVLAIYDEDLTDERYQALLQDTDEILEYVDGEVETLEDAIDLKAPLASPTFTGTATAPTINATSSLQINGSSVQEQLNTKQLKNWIINGGFDVWQRGTSQTTSGYGSDDRWTNEHAGSTKTHSRQSFTVGQTDVPNNPAYFSRTVVSSVAGAGNFVVKAQKLEDVRKLAGKTVALSFWAKADSNKNLAIDFTQVFGSGGSVGVSGIGTQKFALTSSWQKFTKTVTMPSISGKTVGTDSHIGIRIWFDAGSNYNSLTDSLGHQSGTFDIANVSLVEGSVPVEWQTEAYADVLRECQRYCYSVFENSGSQNSHAGIGFAGGATFAHFQIYYPTTMRSQPSSITYSGTLNVNYLNSGYTVTSLTVSADRSSTNIASVVAFVASGLTTNQVYLLMRYGDVNAKIIIECEL